MEIYHIGFDHGSYDAIDGWMPNGTFWATQGTAQLPFLYQVGLINYFLPFSLNSCTFAPALDMEI